MGYDHYDYDHHHDGYDHQPHHGCKTVHKPCPKVSYVPVYKKVTCHKPVYKTVCHMKPVYKTVCTLKPYTKTVCHYKKVVSYPKPHYEKPKCKPCKAHYH